MRIARPCANKKSGFFMSIIRRENALPLYRKVRRMAVSIAAIFFLSGCELCFAETGTASYYTVESCLIESGQYVMANKEVLNDQKYTCASWFYSFGTRLKVSRLDKKRKTMPSIIVVVTDRGPAKSLVKKGRIVDLSMAAFAKLAPLSKGVITVKIERAK